MNKLSTFITAGIVTIAVAAGTGYGVHQHDQTALHKQQTIVKNQKSTIKALNDQVSGLNTKLSQSQQTVTEAQPPVVINATALCNDGTLSYSANHQGTCSYHGGVAVWYQ